jgi:UDP-GlcNAc:undecaprenyl-phosphate GlcNAc-1-phosphate transferase
MWTMQVSEIVIPLLVAFGMAALVTPFVVRAARALDIIDRPTERGVSTREGMPLAGGFAVAIGFSAGFVVALMMASGAIMSEQLRGLIGGSLIVVVAGIIDDRYGMRATTKFGIQIVAASIAVANGFELRHFTEPFTYTTFHLPMWAAWLVSVLWIVGITNAVNLVISSWAFASESRSSARSWASCRTTSGPRRSSWAIPARCSSGTSSRCSR